MSRLGGILLALAFALLSCAAPRAPLRLVQKPLVSIPEMAAKPPQEADRPATLLREISRSSVRIRVDRLDGHTASGSGTVISVGAMHALVLTAAHVVDGEIGVLVDFDTEGVPLARFPATVERVDADHDLALVSVIGPVRLAGARAASIAEEDADLYSPLYVVASPLGIPRQSAIERLNSKDAQTRSVVGQSGVWMVTGMIVPGMSGAAAFDERGSIQCVLVACAGHDDEMVTSIGYAIPRSYVVALVKGYKL